MAYLIKCRNIRRSIHEHSLRKKMINVPAPPTWIRMLDPRNLMIHGKCKIYLWYYALYNKSLKILLLMIILYRKKSKILQQHLPLKHETHREFVIPILVGLIVQFVDECLTKLESSIPCFFPYYSGTIHPYRFYCPLIMLDSNILNHSPRIHEGLYKIRFINEISPILSKIFIEI